MSNITIFGGTGFIGSHITDYLSKEGHHLNLLVRNHQHVQTKENVSITEGDVENIENLKKILQNADVAIYSIGMIREFRGLSFQHVHFELAKKCIDVAVHCGVSHFVMISANGARLNGTAYQKTKFLGEEYLRNSGLNYTILKPSVIFGKPKNLQQMEFCKQLHKDMLSLPKPLGYFAPLFFQGLKVHQAGKFELAPVHVKDLAWIVSQVISDKRFLNQTDVVCGQSISFQQIIQTLSQAIGEKKCLIPTPAFLIQCIAYFFEKYQWFPVSIDQMTMLLEGNTADSQNAEQNIIDLFSSHQWTCFDVEALHYLRQP